MSKVLEYPLSEEYKKDTGIMPEDVRMFREWLVTQPHLPNEHITDLILILAYDACGRSLSVSKEVLDLHFTLKTHMHNFFKNRVFDARMDRTAHICLIKPLPTRSKEGYACLYGRLTISDANVFNFSDVIRLTFMVTDLWQHEEGTWPGFIIVIDMEGSSFGHLPKFDLQTMQQYVYFLQEAMLIKLKQIHFINAPWFMDKLMSLVRPLLKKSLLENLHIHQIKSKTLDNFYPIEALPKEAGGEYKTLAECRDEVVVKLKANNEYFIGENLKRVTESRRLGKPKTVTDFFGGLEGSFKKLDID